MQQALFETEKRIVWLNGQGIDGVGSTKFQIEFSKSFKHKKIVNFKSKAKYGNSKNFELNDFKVVDTDDIFNELKEEGVVYVNSFPNNKNSIAEIDEFYKQIEFLHAKGVILVFFMHFNTMAYFIRQPKILLGLNFMDYIFTFNADKGEYAEVVRKYLPHKANRLRSFGLPFYFDNIEYGGKMNSCIYVGRAASFKQPELMIELAKHCDLTDVSFNFYGIGRTRDALGIIENPMTEYLQYGQSPSKGKIGIYNIAPNAFMQGLMRSSLFAFSGYKLKSQNYGNKSDYAIYEYINNKCIVILTEHFLKNAYVDGKSLFDYNAFLYIKDDLSNLQEVADKMKFFKNNSTLAKEHVEKQLEIYREFGNPMRIVNEVESQIRELDSKTMETHALMTKLLGTNVTIQNVAFDVPDLKLKKPRVYIQKKSRLAKIFYK